MVVVAREGRDQTDGRPLNADHVTKGVECIDHLHQQQWGYEQACMLHTNIRHVAARRVHFAVRVRQEELAFTNHKGIVDVDRHHLLVDEQQWHVLAGQSSHVRLRLA